MWRFRFVVHCLHGKCELISYPLEAFGDSKANLPRSPLITVHTHLKMAIGNQNCWKTEVQYVAQYDDDDDMYTLGCPATATLC